jgi:polysaccharide deacetylase family protein (PEP-CTERM system associated)
VRILTFDIEDWFHIEFDNNISTWNSHQSRIRQNLDKILELLKEKKQPATFFCLGWIAEKYPALIRNIDNLGYEIGSHSYDHKLIFTKTPNEFEEDLKRSIFSIENATGKKITSFRAPAFSLNERTLWAFEILHKFGIDTDSSVFPVTRDFGGFSGFSPARPVIVECNGIRLKEFPVNMYDIMGIRFVFSGGGYFRLLPYSILKKLTESSEYVMTYLHPRDMDPDQPVLEGLPAIRKFKSYVGLSSCYSKLEKLLQEFKFDSLSGASSNINWEETEIIYLQ